MTKKRFIKLLMSERIRRNEAVAMYKSVRKTNDLTNEQGCIICLRLTRTFDRYLELPKMS